MQTDAQTAELLTLVDLHIAACPTFIPAYIVDDIRQEVRIAALVAFERWDPSVAPLAAFMRPRLRGAIVDAYRVLLGDSRRLHKPPPSKSIDVELAGTEPSTGEIITLADTIAASRADDPEARALGRIDCGVLRREISYLPPVTRRRVRASASGASGADISRTESVSEGAVSQSLSQGRRRLAASIGRTATRSPTPED